MAVNVAAMLLVFIALIAMLSSVLGGFGMLLVLILGLLQILFIKAFLLSLF